MSREYPDWVDPWKAAEGRRQFAGTIPMERMGRLRPLLDGPAGKAGFSARFAYDAEGWAVIRIEVSAELPLICQRSLKRYLEPVKRQSVLAVLRTLEEEAELPGHYEPVLAEQGRLALQDLVEDELLLGVPQVPRDPAVEMVRFSAGAAEAAEPVGRQAAPDAGGNPPTRKPFEGLAEQLKKHARKPD